jgi:hypothetical protein
MTVRGVAVALCATTALVTPAVASAANAAPRTPRVITLYEVNNSFARLIRDRPPRRQLSKGDIGLGSAGLENAAPQFGLPKAAFVGTIVVRAAYASPTSGRVTTRTKLPGGTIVCEGPFHTRSDDPPLKIMAATGAFSGASGTCDEKKAPKNRYDAKIVVIYTLRLP